MVRIAKGPRFHLCGEALDKGGALLCLKEVRRSIQYGLADVLAEAGMLSLYDSKKEFEEQALTGSGWRLFYRCLDLALSPTSYASTLDVPYRNKPNPLPEQKEVRIREERIRGKAWASFMIACLG